jgi:hypothetical protein
MNHASSVCKPLLLLACCLAIAGCGKSLAEVSGTVTYKGKALKGGSVLFRGSDGVEYPVNIDAEGKYVTKVMTGDAQVLVTWVNDEAMTKYTLALSAQARGAKDGKLPTAPPPPPESFSLIPEKYGEYPTSGLTTTVKRGKNTYDIALN